MKDPYSPPGERKKGSGQECVPLRTTRDACGYLQCTRRFLERMVRIGRLRALKPSRKLIRFRQADLEAFLESSATGGKEQ